jgi:hypothetical protein
LTKQKIEFEYFHGIESEQFTFYRIPKVLFTDEYFKDLSSDAKILYGLMLDRLSLSKKHHWFDKDDKVYIIFTLDSVMQYMNCGRDKGMKVLAELDTKKGIGLIERIKQGFGKPDIIYIKNFVIKKKITNENNFDGSESGCQERQPIEVENLDLSRSEKQTCQKQQNQLLRVKKAELSRSGKPTYRGRKKQPNEVEETDLMGSEKPAYRGRKNRLIVVDELDPNYTDNNYTDFNNINPINPSKQHSGAQADVVDPMDEIRVYSDIIKTNIEYDILIRNCKASDQEYIDEIVEIMVETICMKRNFVIISDAEYPHPFVKGKLLKVDFSHIQYILECLHKNTSKIRNIRSYLLTCIFNAPSTIGSYYRSEVNHDMHGGE